MAARPDLAEVRAFVRIPATTLPDTELQRIYDGCADDQSLRCLVPDDPNLFPDALSMAFLRRNQREIAVRNLPLGVIGADAEYGPQRISQYDAIIDAHERPYYRQVLA
jgi:hypothetical protein